RTGARAQRVSRLLQPGPLRAAALGTAHGLEQRLARRVVAGESGVAERPAADRPACRARDRFRDPVGAVSRHRSWPCAARRRSRRRPYQRTSSRSPARANRRVASLAFHSCGVCTFLRGSLMPERTVQIVNKAGLHARPAAEIVKLAAKYAA